MEVKGDENLRRRDGGGEGRERKQREWREGMGFASVKINSYVWS